MKRFNGVLLVLSVLLLMAGCASAPKQEVKVAVPAPQSLVIGAEGVPQPSWVYKSTASDDMHYETGYGMMSNRQNSIKKATVEAKNKIAEWINTNVNEVVVSYVNDAGSDTSRQAIDAMEIVSKQVAQASLYGVTTEDIWVDADGGVWVLCKLPLENVQKSFDDASKVLAETFQENEAAVAANAKMQEAFARLMDATN